MTGIVLFGAGSTFCVEAVETCRRNGQHIAAAIRNVPGAVYCGEDLPLLEAADVTPDVAALPFLVPLFRPENRRIAVAAAIELGFDEAVRLVDRTAIVASDCRVEAGVYVNAGCVIGSQARLDRFALCNRGANIGHHCRIGAFTSIGPGAVLAGMVTVGDETMVGAGAIVLPEVRIGAGALVAPGAVVARDIPDGGFAAGNPARISTRPPAKD
jgi:sugar O-acyltransferase (sialic acid O-acetyltransferase NeuD family)